MTLIPTRSRLGALGGAVLAVCLSATAAPAQAIDELCPDGVISGIRIENHSVFDIPEDGLNGRFEWAYRLANRLHVQTRREVIEREILFEVGDCYDVELLRDSERLLRAFTFIADANVFGVREADGSVEVVVDTQDEWSTRVEPRFGSSEGSGLRGIRLVEDNLAGTGRHLALYVDEQEANRVYGAVYRTPHFFGTRWNAALEGARTPIGYRAHQSATYPFVGEVGRVAFREVVEQDERYFELFMAHGGELLTVLVPVRRQLLEVAGAWRRSSRRFHHTFLGAGVAVESITYPGEPHVADFEDDAHHHGRPLDLSHGVVRSTRAMFIAGQRNVTFVRRHALDTVNGTEDVQLGVEAETSLGPTLPGLSTDQDIAVSLGLFVAGELTPLVLMGAHFAYDARRSYETVPGFPEWNDVFAELDGWAYLRSSPEARETVVVRLSAVGGWHARVPFQLTLGGAAGLRGYPQHVDPGGRRVIGSLEHRAYLGWPLPRLFDLGSVVFLDVGKMWAGHAPFGTTSPVRAGAGVGLRAAFPPGSRQTFRADLGVPIQRSLGTRDLTLTIGVGQMIGRRAVLRDPQLMRSARYGLTAADFLAPGLRP